MNLRQVTLCQKVHPRKMIRICQKDRSQLEGTPTDQILENLSIKVNNGSSALINH